MTNPASTPALPAPRLSAHPTALVAQDAVIAGSVTLGPGCIVHPRASILAESGPITLGADCVVEELAVIRNEIMEGGRREGERGREMVIGDGNQFSVGCDIQAHSIGRDNTFLPRSFVSSLVAITDNCTVGPGVAVYPELGLASPTSGSEEGGTAAIASVDTIPAHTAIHGSTAIRRPDGIASSTPNQATETATVGSGVRLVEEEIKRKRLEFLRDNLPKYCRMRA